MAQVRRFCDKCCSVGVGASEGRSVGGSFGRGGAEVGRLRGSRVVRDPRVSGAIVEVSQEKSVWSGAWEVPVESSGKVAGR